MKSRFLLVLTIAWLASSPGGAAEGVSDFSGLYRVALGTPNLGGLKLDFIIKRTNEIMLIKHFGEIELADEEPAVKPLHFALQSNTRTLGPDTLPIATVNVHFGSDEETYAIVLRLINVSSWEGSGQTVVTKVVDGILTFNDGPNDFATATALESFVVSKWDTTVRMFIPLDSI